MAHGAPTALLSHKILSQAFRFVFVGLACVGLNVAFFAVLVDGLAWNYLTVTLISYVCVSAVGFAVNRLWTFQAADGVLPVQAVRFVVIQGLSFPLNIALMWLLVGRCGIDSAAASVVVSVLFALGNFLAQRGWAFRRK